MAKWESICHKQFQLAYFSNFSYSEIDEMTVHERETVYGLLVKQKKDEKEAYEKAMKESKAKSKNKSKR